MLMIGEVRDAETARIAVESAFTGHLVLATLHVGEPAEALHRLLQMGVEPYLLGSALKAVLTQRLLRRTCIDCAGKGCDGCHDSGFRGRLAVGRLAWIDEGVVERILARSGRRELREALVQSAGQPIVDAASDLVRAGLTTEAEVRRVLGEEA